MSAAVFKGMMPALMTPCLPDRTPDFDALVRKGKEMMEAGMSAVIYAGSMGDWPLLTDAQRMEGVERLGRCGDPCHRWHRCDQFGLCYRPCRPCAERRRSGIDGHSPRAVSWSFHKRAVASLHVDPVRCA